MRLICLSGWCCRKWAWITGSTFTSRQVIVGIGQVSNHQEDWRVIKYDVVKCGTRVFCKPYISYNCNSTWVWSRAGERKSREGILFAHLTQWRVSTDIEVLCAGCQTCQWNSGKHSRGDKNSDVHVKWWLVSTTLICSTPSSAQITWCEYVCPV